MSNTSTRAVHDSLLRGQSWASRARASRRRVQQLKSEMAAIMAEYRTTLEYRRQARNRKRRRWPRVPLDLIDYFCSVEGRKGGRPPTLRRCRHRLGSRFCWNWSLPGGSRLGKAAVTVGRCPSCGRSRFVAAQQARINRSGGGGDECESNA